MAEYRNIVVGLELEPEADKFILAKAKSFAGAQCDIVIVHAIEHLASFGATYGVATNVDVEKTLLENAEQAMQKMGGKYGINSAHQVVKLGPARAIILEEADKRHADLIVVGSHGRHGIRLLLGSTANAVLHSAKCDVLAVRVKG